ncbi:hypothetical protein LOZ58_000633 [Ophidiomyces ophidiicola]|nr:hypothetical protein LOZ58_000633 [Ophidiomyces ophidiicola]
MRNSTVGSDKTCTIEIFAVHGFGQDVNDSWRHPNSQKIWLEDFLPRSPMMSTAKIWPYSMQNFAQFSDIRIFTLAEQLLNDLSDDRETKNRQCPIVFIGHSLGGIVIKTALIYAHSRPTQFKNILDSTKAVLFFSTPHQGSTRADWEVHLRNLGNIWHLESSPLNELKLWSHSLAEKTMAFSEIAPELDITTFFGTLGKSVVDEGSARLGLRNERVVALHTTDEDICRFADEQDSNYIRVLRRLEAVVGDICRQTSLEHIIWIVNSLFELVIIKLTTHIPTDMPTEVPAEFITCMDSLRLQSSKVQTVNIESPELATCKWIKNHPKFKAWEQDASGLLIVSGQLGCNTTVLAKYMESELQNTVSFFNDQIGHHVEPQMVCALVFSVLDKKGTHNLQCQALEEYWKLRKCNGAGVKWPPNVLRRLLRSFRDVPCILILDALDKASDIKEIADLLEDMVSPKNPGGRNLKILCTVKSTSTLQLALPYHPHISLDCMSNAGNGILRWVLFAKRALFVSELQAVVDMDTDSKEEFTSDTDKFEKHVIHNCQGFIEIRNGKIQLIHGHATRYYLLGNPQLWWSGDDVDTLEVSSHSEIAQRCLDFLLSDKKDFQKYAIQFWTAHLNQAALKVTNSSVQRFMSLQIKHSSSIIELSRTERGLQYSEAVNLLHIASELGHEQVVKCLVRTLDEINEKDNDGRTALLLATMHRHSTVIDVLLRQEGIDINAEDYEGWTPISYAAKYGYEDICKLLVEFASKAATKLDINKRTFGLTPLYIAAQENHVAIAQLLYNYGQARETPVNGVDPSLLHQAAREGSQEAITIFLDIDSSCINRPDEKGRTALYFAAQENHSVVVSILTARAKCHEPEKCLFTPEKHNPEGRTLLHYAAEAGSVRAVEILIGVGANKDAVDNNKRTPLHQAVSGTVHDVKVLLSHGVHMEVRDNEGNTPLHLAVHRGDAAVDIVALLIEAGADLTTRNNNHQTLLHTIARNGKSEKVANVLLGQGKQGIDARNPDGKTALHLAVQNKNIRLVDLLISRGADINAKDNKNHTPLFIAKQYSEDIWRLLAVEGARTYYQGPIPLRLLRNNTTSKMISKLNINTIAQLQNESDPKTYVYVYAILQNMQHFLKLDRQTRQKKTMEAIQTVKKAISKWSFNLNDIPGLVKLTQHDIFILCDDSRSMNSQWEFLQQTLRRVAEFAMVLNEKGVTLHFLNNADKAIQLTNENIDAALTSIKFSSGSELGTQLEDQILRKIFDQEGGLQNPVIIMIITDGKPSEAEEILKNKILDCKKRGYRNGAMTFLISQIGCSSSATTYLKNLESDNSLKDMVFIQPDKSLNDLKELAKDPKTGSTEDRRYTTLLMKLFSAALTKEKPREWCTLD